MQSGQKLDRDFLGCNFPIAFGICARRLRSLFSITPIFIL